MATVYVGSARIDEKGNARGGQDGDQTRREVVDQPWYKHLLGWVVIRAKSPVARKKIAAAMLAACSNNLIGYNQGRRDTLYAAAKPVGFNPNYVKVSCATDCSALVRVCCAYAGIMIGNVPRFATNVMPKVMKATKQFDILTDPIYTDHPDRLLAGDILCTKVSGHTVVVLNDGAKAYEPVTESKVSNLPTLKLKLFHMKGAAVKLLQTELLKWNSKCLPKYGADGDFGKETDTAVRAYQKAHRLEVDGIVGVRTWGSLLQ
jgi:peptidoglycan hydrolase-like protein with peptidoglycan-binding domain